MARGGRLVEGAATVRTRHKVRVVGDRWRWQVFGRHALLFQLGDLLGVAYRFQEAFVLPPPVLLLLEKQEREGPSDGGES